MEGILLNFLPDLPVHMIMKELHRSYMRDICKYINHNLIWVRFINKNTKEFEYTFLIGENKSNRYLGLADDAPCRTLTTFTFRRIPFIKFI